MLQRVITVIKSQWAWTLGALAALGWCATLLTFYPGYLSNDSVGHLGRALGVYPVSDLSPPAMTLLWRVLIDITGVTASMLALQLAMLWGSLVLLAWYVLRVTGSKKASVVPIGIGTLPFVLNIAGVIWTDTQLAYSLLLALSLLLWLRFVRRPRLRAAFVTASLLLVSYACLVRYNAIVAILPLIFLVIQRSGFALVSSRRRQLAATSIVAACIGIAFPAIGWLMGATSGNPTAAIMLDDIANVSSVQSLKDQAMPVPLRKSLIAVRQCATAKGVVVNNFWVCTTDRQRQVIQFQHYADTKQQWLRVVTHNPVQYVLYRAEVFTTFLFIPESIAYIWQDGIAPNALGQHVAFERLGSILEIYVKHFGYKHFPFFFEPWFWLVLSAALLGYAVRRLKGSPHRAVIIALTSSGIIYILGYFPTGATGDYRYIYWPVLASLLAVVLVFLDQSWLRQSRLAPMRRKRAKAKA